MPSGQSEHSPAVQVFISYAREDRIYLERLLRFLSVLEKRGIISVWYDSLLPAGVRFAAEIDECIDRADIFIALISIDFLGSAFCFDHELGRARSVAAQRELTILPVLVSPCDWAATELGTYNALPFGSESSVRVTASRPPPACNRARDRKTRDEPFLDA